jgi:radical SAM protein with 4Fe4S-binding SPASM domain
MTKFQDEIRILSYLTTNRIWNLGLLYSSYVLSRIIKKPILFGKPFSISIEPTTACNLACPECPSGKKEFSRNTGKISLEMNQKILNSIGKQLFYVNYYFQGEPFLHPNFLDLIKQAKKHNIYTSTSTNAHFISKKSAEEIVTSGLDRLLISIDGVTQTTYEGYRIHGKLEKVIEASKLLVQAKKELKSKTPHLVFQFLVVKPNEKEIPEVYKLAQEIGITDIRLKTAQLYDYKHGNPLMPDNEDYSRYKRKKDGTYRLKHTVGNRCWRMWSSCVFTWDGNLVPCCFDKDAQHTLGSISSSKSFNAIWKSNLYQNFRKTILTKRDQIEICKNCSEGNKVWL